MRSDILLLSSFLLSAPPFPAPEPERRERRAEGEAGTVRADVSGGSQGHHLGFKEILHTYYYYLRKREEAMLLSWKISTTSPDMEPNIASLRIVKNII